MYASDILQIEQPHAFYLDTEYESEKGTCGKCSYTFQTLYELCTSMHTLT